MSAGRSGPPLRRQGIVVGGTFGCSEALTAAGRPRRPRRRLHVGAQKEAVMEFEHIQVDWSGEFATVTMNRPQRRNALSLGHMRELITAFSRIGESDALGIMLAGNGPVFSAGHDFAQVASADLAVASEDAGFAAPGGKGGWFCHTPMVAIARNIGRKRAAELALSGDVIDARTALDWGLVNHVVPAGQLDAAVYDLLKRVTRGSAQSKGIGKQALYAQIDLDQAKAYAYAIEVMAATSQLPDAREGMRAFLDKREPRWQQRRD